MRRSNAPADAGALHENVFSFDTYRVNCNSFLRLGSGSCRRIPGPGVPGATNLPASIKPANPSIWKRHVTSTKAG